MTKTFQIDFPKFTRFGVGFDRIFDEIEHRMAMADTSGYPPYNLTRVGDNKYVIELAVAGFSERDLSIELKDSVLTIKGNILSEVKDEEENKETPVTTVLWKGLSSRQFNRQFTLSDDVEVLDAGLKNGILTVNLVRNIAPEEEPKKIAIKTS